MRRSLNEHDSTLPGKRTSLPRLSSLASLQALNPFTRRRSNNNLRQSSSTLSLTQTRRHKINNEDDSNCEEDAPQTSSTGKFSSAQSSTQVSTSPIRGRWPPRHKYPQQLYDRSGRRKTNSNTLSNLPLPVKSNTELSRPKARLPRRQSQQTLISSRIPSPPAINKRHSAAMSKILCADASNLKRSGTESLLKKEVHRGDKTGDKRSTRTFKENFCLSPTQLLPPTLEELEKTDLYGSSPPLARGIPLVAFSNQNMPPVDGTPIDIEPRIVTKRSERMVPAKLYQGKDSKCVYQKYTTLNALPYVQPMQRWNSQPVISTQKASQSPIQNTPQQRNVVAEIQQTTPQIRSEVLSKETADETIGGNRLPSSESYKSLPTPPSRKKLCQIDTPQPIEFWTGRLIALGDRYRNEELEHILSLPNSQDTRPDGSSSEKMHSAGAAIARQRRALEEMYTKCTTEEARRSLVAFQSHMSDICGSSELAKPLHLAASSATNSGGVKLDTAGADLILGSNSARRKAFIDRLLGKSSIRGARAENGGDRNNTGGKRLSWV